MAAPALAIVMPFSSGSDVNFALRLATATALRELRAHPSIPKLYKSGVRYQRDPKRGQAFCDAHRGACEPFLSPLEVLRRGKGDCDDLAPWLAAERILEGDAGARAEAIDSPGVGYHVIVIRGDGRREDPSKVLGMKPTGASVAGCACQIGAEEGTGAMSKAEVRAALARNAEARAEVRRERDALQRGLGHNRQRRQRLRARIEANPNATGVAAARRRGSLVELRRERDAMQAKNEALAARLMQLRAEHDALRAKLTGAAS